MMKNNRGWSLLIIYIYCINTILISSIGLLIKLYQKNSIIIVKKLGINTKETN